MPHANVNGVKIYYEISGTGPTVIQIGGAVNGHEGYGLITPHMKDHFTVIDFDHRGYGYSDRPAQKYTMETWVDDMAALLDALGVEKCHVHGGSMGGFIACLFGAKYPDRVDRLVFNGAVAKCDWMARTNFYLWKQTANQFGLGSEELALMLLTHAFSRKYLDEMVASGNLHSLSWMQDSITRNASLDVFADACDAMAETDVTGLLGGITAPTLVLHGDEDILTPLDCGPDGAGARVIAEGIPGAELYVLRGCGHGVLFERADEAVGKVIEFLKA
ncbi:MAG: 3-oxoadipate enol-lactonase [Thermomicrobiales bacterium]|jgi:pimeloyl-ACP methyl ester carboxylesterase|nr:3-oxoadipate enol-lactonase [Thermomicrobiales bacterium]